MKTLTCHKIHKTIISTYLDHQDVVWSFEAVVMLTRSNEIEHVEILWADNNEQCEFTENTWDGIVDLCGDRAMDAYSKEDFAIEDNEL